MELPQSIHSVVDAFSKLPGVGEKTATRQTLVLTGWPREKLERFGRLLSGLADLGRCARCAFFCEGGDGLCAVCADPARREAGRVCVVESATDLLAVERSGRHGGVYHVLGGVLNPLFGVGPDDLRLGDLTRRIGEEGIGTVVLAVNPSVEGDATASYIRDLLPERVGVERIGLGVPVGGSLEYLDSMTISKALENARRM